jgi:hypothetical protein
VVWWWWWVRGAPLRAARCALLFAHVPVRCLMLFAVRWV